MIYHRFLFLNIEYYSFICCVVFKHLTSLPKKFIGFDPEYSSKDILYESFVLKYICPRLHVFFIILVSIKLHRIMLALLYSVNLTVKFDPLAKKWFQNVFIYIDYCNLSRPKKEVNLQSSPYNNNKNSNTFHCHWFSLKLVNIFLNNRLRVYH